MQNSIKDSILVSKLKFQKKLDLQPTEADLQLRAQVEREDKYNLFEKAQSRESIVLFRQSKVSIRKLSLKKALLLMLPQQITLR